MLPWQLTKISLSTKIAKTKTYKAKKKKEKDCEF